jgi:hypothetical protein
VPNVVLTFEISNIEELSKQKKLKTVLVQFDVQVLKPSGTIFL